MLHLMRAAAVQFSSVQHAVQRFSDVGFVEGVVTTRPRFLRS